MCLELSTLAHSFTLLSLWQGPRLAFSRSIFCLPFFCLWGRRGTVSEFCLSFYSVFDCLCIPITFCTHHAFLCLFFAKPPFILKFSFMLTRLCNYSFPSSIAFACSFLYFREPLLSAGHGVLPSVQDDMSGWRDASRVDRFYTYSPCLHPGQHMVWKNSQKHLKTFPIWSEENCFVRPVSVCMKSFPHMYQQHYG